METKQNFESNTVVVTGATSGIGYQAAQAFAERGAWVIGVGRSQERCEQSGEKIRTAYPHAHVRYLVADLSLQSQARRLAEKIKEEIHKAGKYELDILVNNAGIYSGKYIRTAEGIELTLAVNHLAPFLLTHELLPLLIQAPQGRILTVSSDSHQEASLNVKRLNKPLLYIGIRAYQVTKLANVLFTNGLNRRLASSRVRAFAVDPGLVNTEIGLKSTDWLSRLVWQARRSSGVQPDVPVRTILYLAGEPSLQEGSVQRGDIYWHDCRPVPPSRTAVREDLAEKLWQVSCQLCDIHDQGKESSYGHQAANR